MLLQVLFFAVIGIIILSIALKIPGVELICRPLFGLLQKLVEYIVTSAGSWLMYLIQTIFRAHRVVVSHLLHDEEYYDIRLKVERANRKS